MRASPRTWLWASAAISLAFGFLLVMSDSGAGWFLIIMAIVNIGAATRAGNAFGAHGAITRWGLVAVTLLLVVLVLLTGVVLLNK